MHVARDRGSTFRHFGTVALVLAVIAGNASDIVTAQTAPSPNKVVVQGLRLEFQAEILDRQASDSGLLRSGEDVRFNFHLSDTASGNPLQGLHPAAWVDLRRTELASDSRSCTRKAADFLGDSLLSVPSVDLNAWYVLAMNDDATISVVNPRFGFGGSQLLAMVFLDSPAEDWALSDNEDRVFVSMPESKRIGVVDAASWKVAARLDLPNRPSRLALQPDDRYLWASYIGGVAVIDTEKAKIVSRVALGEGPHEIAFSSDSHIAFISSRDSGMVSVVDTTALRKSAEVPTGGHPSSIAYSELSQALYAANEDHGGIVAVNSQGQIVARMPAASGIRQIRAAPGGRFVLAVNPDKEQLLVIDTSSNRVVQTAVIHGGPDQVTFSGTLAYVRRRNDATVLMIPLDRVGVPDAPLPLVDFPGGQLPFGKGSHPSPADSIVRVPGGNAVLVANPGDGAVYYYQEGMAAPMGQFQDYNHEPRAVMAVDRGLEENPRGVYQTVARMPQAGVYDVVFFLDSPRIIHCFELEATSALGEPPRPKPLVVHSLVSRALRPGETSRIQFQILDAGNQEPTTKLKDLHALVFEQPGIWQVRPALSEVTPGVYEFQFTPPSAGVYQVYFECPSLGLKFNSPHVLTFMAGDRP